MKNYMNKGAREDTGFTWIVSILIIVFILAMYLIFGVSGAYGSKKLGEDREMILTEGSSKLGAIEGFIGFLDSEVDFNDKKILVKDLVEGDLENNREGFDEFGRLSKEFLADFVGDSDFVSAWIRVYEKNQEVGMDAENSIYGVRANMVVCDPKRLGADVFFVVSHGKKIIFCFRGVGR